MSEARLLGDLNRGRLLVRLVTFGIPLVIGMFFHSLFNLVDLIIVGKLAPSALAAVNQAGTIGFIPQLIGTGINNASIAVISRNFGMRNYKRANANALQAFLLLAFVAVALGIPLFIYASTMNQLIGSTGDALPQANEYLRIMSGGMFTMFALMQVTAILRAGGNARWPMILLVGGNAFNVFLTICMVHGKLGFPAWGVAGAAWSTVIARGIFALLGLYIITRPSAPVRLVLRRIKLRGRMILNLARIGLPSSLQFSVRVVAYGAILNLVTRLGDPVAVHSALAVGFRLDLLATFTGIGWGASAAAMVGQALGAGLRKRAEHAAWAAVILNTLLMAGMGLAFYLWAPWLMSFFGQDPDIDPDFLRMNQLGVEYLRVSVFGYGFAGVGIVLTQSLNGAGSTKMPLLIDVVGILVIQIPIAAYICFRPETYDRVDLWWSLVATTGLLASFYAIVWNRGHWKHKKIQ